MTTASVKKKRRLIYNYDAWAPFYDCKWTGVDSTKAALTSLRASIDLIAGSQVTTVALCPNVGQSVNYPSAVSELCQWRPLSPEAAATLSKTMGESFAQITRGISDLWRVQGIDAYGVLVEHAAQRGLEVFATIRMNDVHMVDMEAGQGPYTDAFYRAHPEWRLWAGQSRHAAGGLNYAVPEVRAHRLAMFEELLRRYDLAGLELDFLRGAPFFPGDYAASAGENSGRINFRQDFAEASAPSMTAFVEEVRAMTRRVAKEKGREIILCARVPSSLSGCRRVGLDPVAWHQRGCLDFITVGRFLQVYFDLPLAEYKRALPGLPVHASIDYIVGGAYVDRYLYARDNSAEIYRAAAAALYAQGADGLTLFNMFAARVNGNDPQGKNWNHLEPLEVLQELGDPATLEDRDKLYLVDATFKIFDLRFFDCHAALPVVTAPDSPLLVKMILAEKAPEKRKLRLRVVLESAVAGVALLVQLNGHTQGTGKPVTEGHLFPEPYDQKPPLPEHCLDFTVAAECLNYGANEIAVLASAPVTVVSIELAVTNRS